MTNRMDAISNSKGKVYYGMHFYPGVCQYQEQGKEPYRVFLNEDTIRTMDPTFAGCPVFVQHVDSVSSDIDVVKKEADGWVLESFYNAADAKHWVKFIVVSERGQEAIDRKGWRLSNCYVPTKLDQGGVWNGITFAKEIKKADYEHLAIVPNPRYEESIILTPEQFKKYNDDKAIELKRLSNQRKDKVKMKLNLFKKTKVENDDFSDIENMSVVLPKTGKEVLIGDLIKNADEHKEAMEKKKDGVWMGTPATQPPSPPQNDDNAGLADLKHKVKMHDGSYCNVEELVMKHKQLHDELEEMKKKKPEDKKEDAKEGESELEMKEEEVDVEGDNKSKNKEGKDMPKGDTPSSVQDADLDDKDAKEKALEIVEHEDKEIEEAKKKNAKEKAEKLRNAPFSVKEEIVRIELPEDRVARGIARYGSSR